MSKIVKSSIDIQKEISVLLRNIVDKNDLTDRVGKFLTDITGKELIPEEKIKDILMRRLNRYFSSKGTKYYDKVKINKLLPFENYKKKYNEKFIEGSRKKLDVNNSTFCYDIIESFYARFNPDYKYKSMSKEVFLTKIKKEKELEILHKFFIEYPTIDRYIISWIEDTKKRFLVSLIKNKLAPLTSIFCFFNDFMDLSENVEYFYKLLDRKTTRSTIQAAIRRAKENIKAGKFRKLE
ncbi:MAG: hypothetical protein WC139_12825 [Candidatus Kapaibacterium sp.]